MENNIAVYICTGCEIGKSLNIEALSKVATGEYKAICKNHDALCSKQGIEMIREDTRSDEYQGIVIAACSPRVKTNEFSFADNQICERVNLREQVVWCHAQNDEDTQMLAEDCLRMGIVKTQKISIPKPYIADDLSSEILVVGGGVTGITAATEAAKTGYSVVLVEKEKELGGWLKELHKQLPLYYPYTESQKPIRDSLISDLKKYENVSILTSAAINEIAGEPGNFIAKIQYNGSEQEYKFASIIIATGWKPYDANKISEYRYTDSQNVITNIEFEQMAKNQAIVKPSDNKAANKVLFIQCAGSRNKDHLPYCSGYCCTTSLKQAKYLREQIKDASAFIVYKDIRTPGHYENYYKEVQKDDQIFLTKGEISSISEANNSLLVEINNSLIGDHVTLEVDLIVLATGMVPAGTEALNLNYRQGKGLPELKYDFPDSHFICFPYETRRTGIYAAGSLRSPMDIASCIDDAGGATLKAIQCLEAVKRGEAVHPRSGDTSFPELDMNRCTDCKRCTEECPFGMYDETEKGTPLPNPARCRRCGICLGACPERIINFKNYSIDSISSVIKSVEIPDEFEEKPRILVFVCENDAYPAFDMAGIKRLNYSAFVRIIPVRCIGSVNKIWVSDALSQGYDGILQIGCKPGDDYQCHFIQGSALSETRSENFQETLQTMMLEPERIQTEFIEINDWEKIPEIIDDYIESIELIGPNPFKGM